MYINRACVYVCSCVCLLVPTSTMEKLGHHKHATGKKISKKYKNLVPHETA